MKRLHGSCLCQAVRFTIPDKVKWSAHCHCHQCQKAHGAAFVTWVGIDKDHIEFVSGEAQVEWYASSALGQRAHCMQCFSPLFFQSERWGDEIHIARALLDDELSHEVQAHAYYDRHVKWTSADPHLPKRGGEDGTQPLENQ